MLKPDRILLAKLLVCFLLPLLVWCLPASWLFPGLSVIQHRLLAIFLLAALLWILEPVPVFATSILIISLELVMISNAGLHVLKLSSSHQDAAHTLVYTDIMAAFSSPIIILFMGGFSLAIAATKYKLDLNLARVLLKPFGQQTRFIMLGLMLVTATFSMFMSNTATTVMMLALLSPIILAMPEGDSGKKALVLCIPVAANIGGIATPIGTPPNAIALQYLIGEHHISFLFWMMMGFPFVAVQLTLAWFLLQALFPFRQTTLQLEMDGEFQRCWQAWLVYIVFAITILLWLTTQLHGMNSYVVAMLPIAAFTLTGVISKAELKLINWDVLWLVAGGIAIGIGLEKTGLANVMANAVDYQSLSPWTVTICLSLICWLMANFMSNTATANLLMPIAAAIGTSMAELSGPHGLQELLVIVAFSASLGMVLPVSTPPNSLAYSTGLITGHDMAKIGLLLGLSGLLLLYIALWIIG